MPELSLPARLYVAFVVLGASVLLVFADHQPPAGPDGHRRDPAAAARRQRVAADPRQPRHGVDHARLGDVAGRHPAGRHVGRGDRRVERGLRAQPGGHAGRQAAVQRCPDVALGRRCRRRLPAACTTASSGSRPATSRRCSARSWPRTSCTAPSTACWSRVIVGLTSEVSPVVVFQGTMARSVMAYLAYGLFGVSLAVLWDGAEVGPAAAVLLLLPLFVARWAYAQYAEEQRAYDRTVRTLMAAVETKDLYTRGHSERVSAASVLIARAIGMREDRVASLRYAGMLHDIGKLGVPDPGAAEVRRADRGRVRGDPAAPDAGPGDRPRDRVPRRGERGDHAPPRAARRPRLPDGAARRRDPRVRPGDRGRGRVRLDDHDPVLPRRPLGRGGRRRAAPLRRHAVRPADGRGAGARPGRARLGPGDRAAVRAGGRRRGVRPGLAGLRPRRPDRLLIEDSR